MTGQLQGKVALVTGGASGIGEAVCELLAREGASVAVTDVDDLKGPEVVARIKKAGGEASFWHHDVTSEERWIEVVAEVMKRYGRLDVLVSNAGIGVGASTITEMSLADWRRQTAINPFFSPEKHIDLWLFGHHRMLRISVYAYSGSILIGSSLILLALLHVVLRRQLRMRGT